MSVKEILSTNMCSNTADIVLDYLYGNQDYWKQKNKLVIEDLDFHKDPVIKMLLFSQMKHNTLKRRTLDIR